jgi:Flp pilus assembly protein TadB
VLEDISEEVGIHATLGGPASDTGLTAGIADVLKETVDALNASAEGDALTLPAADAYGVRYRFYDGASDLHVPEIFALAVFGLLLYRSRYSWIDKRIKAARRSMTLDFPEFIDKLLLMLNAGLVVSEAISRIAADYALRRDEKAPRPLYEELTAIRQRVENTNASLSVELNRMAARSGVRELMRFASVVSDNIDKGSALADKLKAEGELVWKMRKKDVEEMGRLAETKMILPMTLTLLTLILITMAPAVLDM